MRLLKTNISSTENVNDQLKETGARCKRRIESGLSISERNKTKSSGNLTVKMKTKQTHAAFEFEIQTRSRLVCVCVAKRL